MKTARQILLERHAHAKPSLDATRNAVIRALAPVRESWWQTAWREVFLAARPTWTALAALALVAIGLHAGSWENRPAEAEPRRLSDADLTAVREQRHRLWAELLETPAETLPPPPADRRSTTPPHRSQVPTTLWPV